MDYALKWKTAEKNNKFALIIPIIILLLAYFLVMQTAGDEGKLLDDPTFQSNFRFAFVVAFLPSLLQPSYFG